VNLYRVHRIVIGSAIVLGALFAGYSGARFRSTGEPLALALACLSAAVSLGLAWYLRWFLVRHAGPGAPGPRG
jgi:hypothetical protein